MAAIMKYTRTVSYLDDGDLAVLTAQGIQIYNAYFQPVEKPRHHSDKAYAELIEELKALPGKMKLFWPGRRRFSIWPPYTSIIMPSSSSAGTSTTPSGWRGQ